MKILLLGECSNMHWTLAQGLRKLGHDVTVVSDGSKWMNNQRDITLARKNYGLSGTLRYMYDLYSNLNKMKGYDVVQIKNPLFIDMKAERNLWLYKFLKKHNKKVFLGAFGTDFYWIKACLDKKRFRYSDYFVGDRPNNIKVADQHAKEWFGREKQHLNQYIAETCDGIVACLYEYYAAYQSQFSEKLAYISEPVNTDNLLFSKKTATDGKVRFFIGIQSDRHQLKGTDILLEAITKLQQAYPNQVLINKAESIPNHQYLKMMSQSDILLDQIYSYTPGMNALTAMAQGLVVVSGGEPEMYDLLGEKHNQPIINILPDKEDIYNKLENLIINKEQIPTLSENSRLFIEQHHNYLKIAQQYIDFWSK